MARMIRSAAPLQEYGEQFSCTVKRRRVQQDLIAARQKANRYAEMARAATVKVSLGAEINANGRLKVTISDTGIGIAAEDLDKILAPFAQVESDHARKYEGTGLGLPISKAYVELHGGSFTMKSKLGVGTTVTIQFPADRVEHASHEPQNAETAHHLVG